MDELRVFLSLFWQVLLIWERFPVLTFTSTTGTPAKTVKIEETCQSYACICHSEDELLSRATG